MHYALSCCEEEAIECDGVASIIFTGPCIVTDESYSVTVPVQAIVDYKLGRKIQEVLPNMPIGDREFLISGCSPKGFDELFGDGDVDCDE